jgi:hypothetical protein
MIDPTPDILAATAVQLQYARARDLHYAAARRAWAEGDVAYAAVRTGDMKLVARALADEIRCMFRPKGAA